MNNKKPFSIRARALETVKAFTDGITAAEVATILEVDVTVMSTTLGVLWRKNDIKRDVTFDENGKILKSFKYFPIWADQGVFYRDTDLAKQEPRKRKIKPVGTAHCEQFVLDDDAIEQAVNTITTIPKSTDDGWMRDNGWLPGTTVATPKPKAPFKVDVQYTMSAGDQWIEITKEQYEALLEAFDFGDEE